MSDDPKDKRVDEAISRIVNIGTSAFDAEKWRQRHPEAVDALKAYANTQDSAGDSGRRRITIRGSWVFRLAAAAVIVVAVVIGSLLIRRPTSRTGPTGPGGASSANGSPSKMVTLISLKMAYKRGGVEEIDRYLDRISQAFGPRSSSVTVSELLNELNGT